MFDARLLNGKRELWLYHRTKGNTLTLPQRMIYSADAYYALYGKKPPNCKMMAQATGLDAETISAARKRMEQHNLYIDGRVSNTHHTDWFMPAGKGSGIHPFQYLKCYVRFAGSPLSATGACLLSLLYSQSQSGFMPKYGFSLPYFATILGIKKETVASNLDDLQGLNAIEWTAAPFDVLVRRITPEIANLFADKRENKGTHKGTLRFEETACEKPLTETNRIRYETVEDESPSDSDKYWWLVDVVGEQAARQMAKSRELVPLNSRAAVIKWATSQTNGHLQN